MNLSLRIAVLRQNIDARWFALRSASKTIHLTAALVAATTIGLAIWLPARLATFAEIPASPLTASTVAPDRTPPRSGDAPAQSKTPDVQTKPVSAVIGTASPTSLRTTSSAPLQHASGVITTSLDAAARAAGLTPRLRERLRRLFTPRVDFQRDLRPGDTFAVIYEHITVTNPPTEQSEIVAARLSVAGTVHYAIGWSDRFNERRYFSPDGHALAPAAYPLGLTRISSAFQKSRRHPLLGVRRAHTGIDFDAPLSTPVSASSPGTVSEVARRGGYGNIVEIDHGRGFRSRYAHLASFAPELAVGDTVDQGQLIGKVGATGLATGPNLHFEIRRHGRPLDPAKSSLPGERPAAVASSPQFRVFAAELVAKLDQLTAELNPVNDR